MLPMDLAEATFMVTGFHSKMTTTELLALRIRQLQKRPTDIAAAAETLRKSRFTSKAQFEKRFHKRLTRKVYCPGELVLVRNTAIEFSHDRKHKPRYLGPYEVVERAPGGAYILKELDGTHLHQNTIGWRMLPYIQRTHPFMRNNSEYLSDSDSDDERVSSSSSGED